MANKKLKVPSKLPNKLAIYVRVSSQQQVKEGVSADDQMYRGIEKARELGWEYEIYDDRGSSGTIGYEDRAGFFKLLNDIDDFQIGGMYSVDIDRWSRDDKYEEPQLIISKLKAAQIRVFTPNGEFDFKDLNVELMMRIKGIFASYESLQTKVRVKRGLERSMLQGNNAGGGALIAYGYDRKNKELYINKEEADVVKKIFELYISGMGTYSIANYLQEQKIPTKRNKAKNGNMKVGREKEMLNDKGQTIIHKRTMLAKDFVWRDSVVLAILKNPIYKGKKRFNELKIESPIIIDPDIFDSVQGLFNERKRFKSGPNSSDPDSITKNQFLLKGLIKCGFCDKSFYGKLRKDLKDKAYVCLSQRYKNEFCGNKGIDINFLNDLVWTQTLKVEENVIDFFEKYEKDELNIKHREWIKSNEIKIKDLTNKKLKLLRNFNEEIINESDFKVLNKIYDEEIKGLLDQNEESVREIALFGVKDKLLFDIKTYFNKIDKDTISFQEKQNCIRAFVKSVKVVSGFYDGHVLRPRTHQIGIEFKLDNLTNFKLSREVEIGYKKNGHRDGILKQEIKIEQWTLSHEDGYYDLGGIYKVVKND